jgi:hypothetical protein
MTSPVVGLRFLPQRDNIARRDEPFLLIDGAGLKIPTSLDFDPPAHLAVKRRQKRRHQFVIFVFLGLFEQPFDHGLMAGTIQRLREVGKNLFACPRPRIFFPAVSERRQRFGLARLPERFEKKSVLIGEIFFRQQHLTALISRSSHG